MEEHGYANDFSKDTIRTIVPYLQNKGYTIIQEYDNGYQKNDIYIKELNLWVEIDGSVHYYSNSKHETGKTWLKYMIFDKACIKEKHKLINYVRISHHDFTTTEELLSLLDSKLSQKTDDTKYIPDPHLCFDKFLK